jgi:hypothetical protein
MTQFFEGQCNLWKTNKFCLVKGKVVNKKFIKIMKKFVSKEQKRHKNGVSDISIILAMYATVIDSIG